MLRVWSIPEILVQVIASIPPSTFAAAAAGIARSLIGQRLDDLLSVSPLE
jgi:hypothetical protein